jgi:hypothetical protein
MLLRVLETEWERVREQFTDEEKRALRRAIEGEMICPKGVIINIADAGPAGVKLKELLDWR